MLNRIRETINYLTYKGLVKNDTDLAAKLKYTKSSLSQILNGKVPADKFIEKLCNTFQNINSVWILTGEGSMLKGGDSISHNQDNNASFNVLSNVNSDKTLGTALEKLICEISEQRKSYTDMIAKRDEQIDKLIDKLTEK